jgi:hypothetical protein
LSVLKGGGSVSAFPMRTTGTQGAANRRGEIKKKAISLLLSPVTPLWACRLELSSVARAFRLTSFLKSGYTFSMG